MKCKPLRPGPGAARSRNARPARFVASPRCEIWRALLRRHRLFCLLLAALLLVSLGASATPDEEWSVIVALDAGPGKKPGTREAARLQARTHFAKHQSLIEGFLSKYPEDPRAFDARLRLAAILAAEGKMDNVQSQVDEAMRLLSAVEKAPGAPQELRADAGFRRASLYLQSLTGREYEMRGSIVNEARNFVAKYPGDRRGPRLLVEAATVCDSDPALKSELLNAARALSKEDALNRRIADDLGRLDLLDKPLHLKFDTLQGGTFDTDAQAGNVVVLVFWSAESPHSLMWMQSFRRAVDKLPKSGLRIATVSLDTNKTALVQRMKEFQISDWPTNFDGRGWDNAAARPLGINALPTVFVLDKFGALRALNARDSYDLWVRRLLRK
ncbi:MAG: TlpA disulfide reductase family protein [Verrucomicrobiae bacterium]